MDKKQKKEFDDWLCTQKMKAKAKKSVRLAQERRRKRKLSGWPPEEICLSGDTRIRGIDY